MLTQEDLRSRIKITWSEVNEDANDCVSFEDDDNNDDDDDNDDDDNDDDDDVDDVNENNNNEENEDCLIMDDMQKFND